ncbi:Uu.00g142860.m01.CDS01 [Anthostomella pinea]|uniref:Uu.00g142860.m01.CDS01 n=1 Tax=Anthostomella pinea TaxID=933095 RepID=A0AAI8YLR3_9PEZI|nr:Uu.00g142860.m01.CDS01 [Anthostomella pinea]
MDPISAVGFASSILTFVEFSSKLVRGTYELYQSSNGTTVENAHIGNVLSDLRGVTDELRNDAEPQDRHENELSKLARNCRDLSDELVELLGRLQLKEKDRRWQTLRVAWLNMTKQKSIESIEKRLGEYRAEIVLRLNLMIWYVDAHHTKLVHPKADFELQKECIMLGSENAGETKLLSDQLKSLAHQLEGGGQAPSLADMKEPLYHFASAADEIARENRSLQRLAFPSMHRRENSVQDAEAGTLSWIVDGCDFVGSSEASYGPGPGHAPGSPRDLNQDEKKYQGERRDGNTGYTILTRPSEIGNADHEVVADSSYSSSASGADEISGHTDWQVESRDSFWRKIDPEITEEERHSRHRTSAALARFITSENGLFFVCGKAGSGKSTLMKFLAQDRRLLQDSADGQVRRS